MTSGTTRRLDFEDLRAALATRQRRDYPFDELSPQNLPEGGLCRAAVLVPLLRHDGEICFLFTKRRAHLRRHAGQICFPGGRIDATDADSLAAALRESEEEIGLPPAQVDVLGRLDETLVLASAFRLTPWVGRVPYPFPYTPAEAEVEAILVVPVEELRLPGAHRTERIVAYGVEHDVHFFDVKGEIIWGATARVLTQLLELWEER
jgi:8-oxo-dGTP pyrophosphatase MutT (NUDIX family)